MVWCGGTGWSGPGVWPVVDGDDGGGLVVVFGGGGADVVCAAADDGDGACVAGFYVEDFGDVPAAVGGE
ncbi:Uncharacterised protein [Dermatophilus congolensis]|uniref:Uncharacterized protein n=1 Tax=Dermatophilus congolensis TaxID=1863 RepID=A0AA46BLE5_9MICO|nr:Uncharacterised protein [Dermatophilus congolensis]